LERSVNDVKDRLADQDSRTDEAQRHLKRVEKDKQGLNEQISNLEAAQQKIQDEKAEKEQAIKELHELMAKVTYILCNFKFSSEGHTFILIE
jgi:prefoldin subunit 5